LIGGRNGLHPEDEFAFRPGHRDLESTMTRSRPSVSVDDAFDPTIWPLSGPEILDRKQLKALQRRTDRPGLCFLAIHILALALGGFLIYLAQGSWLIVPAMLLQGTLIVLLFGALHETTHGTAFRTRWLNQAVAWFAAILTLRPALYFKYRHASHHTYTQHDALDPDIVPLPRSLGEYAARVLGLSFWGKLVGTLWRSALGRFNEDERSFIPQVERGRVTREARLLLLIYLAVLAASVVLQSWAAAIYWLVPRILGEPVLRAIRLAEHTAAAETPDLLANTRTTLCNPVLRTLYWNMPFHAEHHLATSIPFHALPALHRQVRDRLQQVAPSYLAAHRDILRAMREARRGVPVQASS